MSGVPDVRRQGVGLYVAVMVLWCMLAPLFASADQFTGKVVGISDGDTLNVLRDRLVCPGSTPYSLPLRKPAAPEQSEEQQCVAKPGVSHVVSLP